MIKYAYDMTIRRRDGRLIVKQSGMADTLEGVSVAIENTSSDSDKEALVEDIGSIITQVFAVEIEE